MKWVFHLGYPKCASSSIQNGLHEIKTATYAGKNRGEYLGANGRHIVRSVLAMSSLATIPYQEVLHWKEAVEKEAKHKGHDLILLSDEIFTSTMVLPRKIDEIITVINRIFGENTEYIFVVRNPAGLIRSNYAQKVKVGYPFDFAQYCDDLWNNPNSSILAQLNFSRIFDYLTARNIKIHVLCFEEIVSNRISLRHFMGTIGVTDFPVELPHSNKSPNAFKLESIRLKNMQDYENSNLHIPHPHRFNVIHELDCKRLMDNLDRNVSMGGTIKYWWQRSLNNIKSRQHRLRKSEPALTPISLRIPKYLAHYYHDFCKRAVKSLPHYLPDIDLDAYGYPVYSSHVPEKTLSSGPDKKTKSKKSA
ncbi:MAG: hypothetical protein ACWA5L_11190 [bacterium]